MKSFERRADMHIRRIHNRRATARTSIRAAILLTGVTACYRITPVTGSVPSSGKEVVVELTDAGSVQLAPLIGNRIELVRGTVGQASDTGVELLLRGATNRTGSESRWSGERIEVPRAYIASIGERSFDAKRSVLLTALLLGGAVLAGGILGGGAGISGIFGGGGGARQ